MLSYCVAFILPLSFTSGARACRNIKMLSLVLFDHTLSYPLSSCPLSRLPRSLSRRKQSISERDGPTADYRLETTTLPATEWTLWSALYTHAVCLVIGRVTDEAIPRRAMSKTRAQKLLEYPAGPNEEGSCMHLHRPVIHIPMPVLNPITKPPPKTSP